MMAKNAKRRPSVKAAKKTARKTTHSVKTKARPVKESKKKQKLEAKASKSKKKLEAKAALQPEPIRIDPQQLRQLAAFASEVAGRDGARIVNTIGETGVTDEIIEKGTSLKIAEVRSILNHLHSFGIVEYTREKNMQNGWFTYTWKLNASRALANFLMLKKREYEALKNKQSMEQGVVFYKCNKGCSKMPLDSAWDNEFKCPKCESRLADCDPKQEIEEAENRIAAIEKILSQAQQLQ
ncbi:MAG TPA: hypothetical protein VGQ00_00150, partial [Candidatus Norongarragalinales archaeon]|nr:hypothetical protein [Candidatus Norongarragalinales archaeon]